MMWNLMAKGWESNQIPRKIKFPTVIVGSLAGAILIFLSVENPFISSKSVKEGRITMQLFYEYN